MKRVMSIMLCLVFLAAFAGCTPSEKGSRLSQVSQVSSSSGAEESSNTIIDNTGPGPQVMEMEVFVQQESDAQEGYEPTIRLLENGNFELSLFLYDGVATLSGTYTEEESSYVLTVTESSAQGFAASEVDDIILEKTDDGVIYTGRQIGVTFDGAVFKAQSD